MAQRIILADTQVIFRAGAARVLAMEDDLRVVAQCTDLQSLNDAIESFRYALVLFPSSMSADLAALMDSIEHAGSKAVVIVENGASLDESITRRARGMTLRSVDGRQLVECLRRVAAGERCIHKAEVKPMSPQDRVGARVLGRLTPKELQIVALVSKGSKNRDIAALLGTTEQVIKNYLRNIYDKTGVSDRLELAVFTLHHRVLADAAGRARQELQASA